MTTTILVVCTGNMCRSPMAAALLRRRLGEAGVQATVESVGMVRDGDPVPPEALEVGARRGVDLSGHRARRLDPQELAGVDLLLGMAREHVREAVVADPELWPRAYTLKELVRRGREAGPRREGEDLTAWLQRVHSGRRTADLLGASTVDDVEDPMGGSLWEFEAMAAELDDLLTELRSLAWPARSGGDERTVGAAGPVAIPPLGADGTP